MMLAACLDAAACRGVGIGDNNCDDNNEDDGDRLQEHVRACLSRGMPGLAGEFEILSRRVWRGRGSIGARHVRVVSAGGHRPARVPPPAVASFAAAGGDAEGGDGAGRVHSHGHSRSHSHLHSHSHSHSHGEQQSQDHQHQHNHHDHHHHDHGPGDGAGPIRNLPEIRSMLESREAAAWIPRWVRETAVEAFTKLAWAEAAVHCASGPDDVAFHEVGAVDSIVDTVGTLLALHCLGVRTASCGRLPLSRGHASTDHGTLPVPAPAALCLMIGMCTAPGPPGATGELVTPTGAALLHVLTRTSAAARTASSSWWGECPPMKLHKVGTGAGTKDFEDHPNILRLLVGELAPPPSASAASAAPPRHETMP
jgi:hypothetical protein